MSQWTCEDSGNECIITYIFQFYDIVRTVFNSMLYQYVFFQNEVSRMGRQIDKLHCRSFVSDVVPQYFSATCGDVSTTRPIAVLAHRSQCLDFFYLYSIAVVDADIPLFVCIPRVATAYARLFLLASRYFPIDFF